MRHPPRIAFLISLLVLILLGGCYSHSVSMIGTSPGGTAPPATEAEGTVAWSILWGVYKKEPMPTNCQGQALAEVKASSNLGFTLLTVVTLGAAAPVRLDWWCARPTPPVGDFPIPDTTSQRSPYAP